VIVITATHSHPMATPHPTIASFDEIETEIAPERIALRMRAPAAR
jgi:hypothetical protein